MKIKLLVTGKQTESYINEGCMIYEKRLQHYIPLEIKFLPEIKSSRTMPFLKLKETESELFLKAIKPADFLVLLDENGKLLSSLAFSSFIQTSMNNSRAELVFAIGGAYGFDSKIKNRADLILSLSPLTFPHQLVRVIFLEQLYRAFTILKKEPYHHL